MIQTNGGLRKYQYSGGKIGFITKRHACAVREDIIGFMLRSWSFQGTVMESVNRIVALMRNYRGITILPKRWQHNMRQYFILIGAMQSQLIIGEALYVCFIDFSKAFHLVNSHILFFKIMKGDWSGRVIDTLKDLNPKTYFGLKNAGRLSPDLPSLTGVIKVALPVEFCLESTSQTF